MDITEKVLEKLQIQVLKDGSCDCNDEECIGCFWPCESCQSNKCGHLCRINRGWKYEVWERQGRSDK
ncbi:ARL14 effector protein-like [Acyrthosiphon pisum]|uniref:ARF7 effector protein C-terminal domain-containing protein n=1 Tax=Acyrthosiphon pisum TaxID=7029 RepID=A0A8R2JUT7_ACYPI|nr:ARL14 effector protein-like [Acyrthosiphon pisum]XP_029346690.1 ARL14 effector protein-like [Acyrthosiphon pisum]|eukprot:XP_008181883.1 PREDICTED: ARL14 effector protein-like [Acyrthosiphon pisum]